MQLEGLIIEIAPCNKHSNCIRNTQLTRYTCTIINSSLLPVAASIKNTFTCN